MHTTIQHCSNNIGKTHGKKSEGKSLKWNTLGFVIKKILKSKKTQLKKFFKLFIISNTVIYHKCKNATLCYDSQRTFVLTRQIKLDTEGELIIIGLILLLIQTDFVEIIYKGENIYRENHFYEK